ncbi:hypothetical protein LTR95_007783 [Oleoguttula sp. CCFEE 5521]
MQVFQITDENIDGAITCIQQAFSNDDPYSGWVFDKSTFSLQRNRVSLGIRCRWGKDYAMFHVAKDPTSSTPDKILGVACWLPPTLANTPQTWSAYIGDWSLYLQQFRMNLWYGRGGLITRRYWIWKAAQAEAQRELWTDPKGYYFCNIVTVLPEAQGKGIGKALFKADEEGVKCYLESSRAEPNMAIYERMGFKLAKEMVLDDDGDAITLYCMIREPQLSS